MSTALDISLTVNGERRAADVEPRLLLAHLLRQGFTLTGTHTGCDTTNCGACTVLYDGVPVKSCTMLAVQADGHQVTTLDRAKLVTHVGELPSTIRQRIDDGLRAALALH